MNLKQIIQSGDALLVVSALDLKEFGENLLAEARALNNEQPEAERYLTTQQVQELFGVSQNTLWRWGRDGYLIPVKFGRTPRYRKSDIDKLLSGKEVTR